SAFFPGYCVLSRTSRWLRSAFIWIGPIVVLLLVVVCGFCYWVLATPSGTRWALVTGARYVDAQVSGISGSVWDGLQVGEFDMPLPDEGRVQLEHLQLRVEWRELLERRLHILDLSAGTVQVDLPVPAEEQPPAEPFSMPSLPISLAVDRFAVDKIVLRQGGEPVPVDIAGVDASLYVDNAGGQLALRNLEVGNDQVSATLSGDANLASLQDPWPADIKLTTVAKGLTPASPLCARNYLDTLPADAQDEDCTLVLDTKVRGNLNQLTLNVDGAGQGMAADVQATLMPRAAFPLKDAKADVTLADGSSLQAAVDWQSDQAGATIKDRLVGELKADKLNIGQLVGDVIPPAVLSLAADFDLQLLDRSVVESADVSLVFGEGSSWNKQALAGHLKTQVVNNPPKNTVADAPAADSTPPAAEPAESASPAEQATETAAPIVPPLLKHLALAAIDMDLTLGPNHLQAKGSLGSTDSHVKLDMKAPTLAAFWPDIPGGAALAGDLAGTLDQHKMDLVAQYTPDHAAAGKVGEAPIDAHVALEGGWGNGPDGRQAEGWRGTIRSIDGDHAGFSLKSDSPTTVSFIPGAQAPAWQWEIGRSRIDLLMDSCPLVTLAHAGSRGGAGRWETQGAIDQLVVSERRIDALRKKLGMATEESEKQGGVKIRGQADKKDDEIALGLDWDFKFAGVLEGAAHIKHLSGDITVPAEPPFPLGLQTLTLDLQAKRASNTASTLTANLNVVTKDMGRITAQGSTLLHARDGSLYLEPKDRKTVRLDADVDDLSWLSLFTGDAMEFGGSLRAQLDVESQSDGNWGSNGTIKGEKLRIVRIDDGIRLLDGTLTAHIDNNRLILDKLSFPARLRAKPKEWRTAEWVSSNPDAQNGSLTLTGEWDIFESIGTVDIDLYRYPLLQRADRYAMLTGKLRLAAELPKVAIKGAITADAGWFDLDMLGGIPTVDSDVVVIRPGQQAKEASVPMDMSLELDVDLGPRFYLTGYGVNSGLVGKLHITMIGDKLTAMGALRTRGGAIETYGQRLQLRRGTITFQG